MLTTVAMELPTPAILLDRLPDLAATDFALACARVVPSVRRIPLGSGEAEEIALRRGWKPLVRQLLDAADVERKQADFARDGFVTRIGQRFLVQGTGRIDRFPNARSGPGVERVLLFAGRERERVDEAAEIERAVPSRDERLGKLLGFPACCIRAFVETERPRETMQLLHRAQAHTAGRGDALLNVTDLRVFHYLPWIPCSFRCAPAIEYATRLERYLREHHAMFAEQVRATLRATRLILHADVQLALRGTWNETGDTYRVERAVPAAQFHPPGVQLGADEVHAVARLLVAVERSGSIRRAGGYLAIDGVNDAALASALLLEFE
jgi:hypothetical protein